MKLIQTESPISVYLIIKITEHSVANKGPQTNLYNKYASKMLHYTP